MFHFHPVGCNRTNAWASFMKKIPEDFDANIFVGRTLEMICFNANQIYFHFDHHLFITAETSFTFNKHKPRLRPPYRRPSSSDALVIQPCEIVRGIGRPRGWPSTPHLAISVE